MVVDATADNLARLHLPAHDMLLEQWRGRVIEMGDDLEPRARIYLGGIWVLRAPEPVSIVRYDPSAFVVPYEPSGSHGLYFDLALGPCRDHMIRTLWGRPGETRCWRAARAGAPKGVAAMLYHPGAAGETWYEGGDWWDGGQGHSPERFLPELGQLDPSNEFRLPDGSRFVDAQALLLLVTEKLKRGAP